MTGDELFSKIREKSSYLCVGLDTDIRKIPHHLLKTKDPVFEFNRQIIEATADLAIAYKPNLAFYESMGAAGWESLQKTMEVVPEGIFTIADAKRGDIGNTSELYARAFFEQLSFDAVTVAPYMGSDSVKPFLSFPEKWVVLLALTSNQGSADFQTQTNSDGKALYSRVLEVSQGWGSHEQLMYVVGATKAELLTEIRKSVPDHFLLVPGVGAQGGSLEEVSRYGMNSRCGLLVNASRSIIYAGSDKDFARAARQESQKLQQEMRIYLNRYV